MDLKNLKTDPTKELEGVWEDFGEGTQILIARIGNKNYEKRLKELALPYKRQIRTNTISEDVYEDLLNKAVAKTIILDWKNLKEDGKEIKYSPEKAYELISNPAYKDFKEALLTIAQEIALFKVGELEDGLKNS